MTALVIGIDARKAPAGLLREITATLRDYRGSDKVRLTISHSEGESTLEFNETVDSGSDELIEELSALLGSAALFSVLP